MIGKAEGVSEEEMNLLMVATAYHDCGFLVEHADHETHGFARLSMIACLAMVSMPIR